LYKSYTIVFILGNCLLFDKAAWQVAAQLFLKRQICSRIMRALIFLQMNTFAHKPNFKLANSLLHHSYTR